MQILLSFRYTVDGLRGEGGIVKVEYLAKKSRTGREAMKKKHAIMKRMLAVMLAGLTAWVPAGRVSAGAAVPVSGGATPCVSAGAAGSLRLVAGESQSFYYIDEDDVDGLGLAAPGDDVCGVVGGKDTNATKLIRINKGAATKTLKEPISSGKVTLETVGYQNSAIFGIKILDSKGNALVNYAQQTSGNLNMYKGTAITGSENTIKLASKDELKVKNSWMRVVTEIDLDQSNKEGVLQFVMTVSYKEDYTDSEWKEAGVYTQKEAYVDQGVASGCATADLKSFDVGAVQFESQGTSYVDDIRFDDGNGIEGIVTSEKTLQGIKITRQPDVTEFSQGATASTAGLEITGTYSVTYSDGRAPETTESRIAKYELEYDFSEIREESPVTVRVKEGDQEFTVSYNVRVVPKPDSSYVTFSYMDEGSVGPVGLNGDNVGVAGGDVAGNASSKIKVDKGTAVKKLADPVTSGTVHFETKFLTKATSGASLFLRILNSEGLPMVEIAQYGSSNLNLYLDKATSGDFAERFAGLPTNTWVRASIDIDLDKSNEEGKLAFEASVWITEDYAGGSWTKFADFGPDAYINGSGAVHSANGSASTKATKLDVAAIELQNGGGSANYYDDMFFEAIDGSVRKELTELKIVQPASKTVYYVGDSANANGLVLSGVYVYHFPDGTDRQVEAEVTRYEVSFDNTVPGENVPVTVSADGKAVSYSVTVLENTRLEDIGEYLAGFVNNRLVTLDDKGTVHVNKRQILLPARDAEGDTLVWEVSSGQDIASVAENVLTLVPSDKAAEAQLKVTLQAVNEDGDPLSLSRTVRIAIPKEGGKAADDSLATEESLRNAVTAMYERGLFEGQESLKDVDSVMASLDREITTEEIAVLLVNLFGIDTTYTDVEIDRGDVKDGAWYSKHVKAAFQLSVETRDSREGKEKYGIGKGMSKANLLYMIRRIVMVDQAELPSDYEERMFED